MIDIETTTALITVDQILENVIGSKEVDMVHHHKHLETGKAETEIEAEIIVISEGHHPDLEDVHLHLRHVEG